jgi:hypothetical protein
MSKSDQLGGGNGLHTFTSGSCRKALCECGRN